MLDITLQKDFERATDIEIIKHVPLAIRVDGRAFTRLTRNLRQPYDPLFSECMAETMFSVISEIGGAVFGFQQSDEITFIIRNDLVQDSEPWYANRLQKLTSISASLTTLAFYKAIQNLDIKLDLVGDPVFDAKVIILPSIDECINNLIWRQKECNKWAVSSSALFLLSKQIGRKSAVELLHSKSVKEKLEILKNKCDIDFAQEYPCSFRTGIAAYKVPFIVPSKAAGHSTKKKWVLDWDFSSIPENREMIKNILTTGSDIVRGEHISSLYEEEI